MIEFTVPILAQPQGSSSAYVRGGRAVVTSANKKLKPFREVVRGAAISCFVMQDAEEMQRKYRANEAIFVKHVPVRLTLMFTFVKPKSVKKRVHMVVMPDCDKLVRGVCDALTGVIYHDDAQVCEIIARKQYGAVESVHVRAEEIA